jgi:hypothetical protein
MVFKIDFKNGFVIVDLLWFEDNRSIDYNVVIASEQKKTHSSQVLLGWKRKGEGEGRGKRGINGYALNIDLLTLTY